MQHCSCPGWSYPSLVAMLFLSAACSAPDDRAKADVIADPAPSAGTAIAEVTLSDTHRVAFYEPIPGVLLVSERGSVDMDPNARVGDFDGGASLYRELVGGQIDTGVLAALQAADERTAIRRVELRNSTPPSADELGSPTESPDLVDKHADFLDGNQCRSSSFEGGYCTGIEFNQIVASSSGWQWCTSRFRSTVFNHQTVSNQSSATHTIFYWGDRGDFWDQVGSSWVDPGTWHSWYSTWRYVKTTTGRTSGQVKPGNHDHCVLRRPYNKPLIDFSGCDEVVACSTN